MIYDDLTIRGDITLINRGTVGERLQSLDEHAGAMHTRVQEVEGQLATTKERLHTAEQALAALHRLNLEAWMAKLAPKIGPVEPTGFQWSNLWKWAILLSGTRRARIALTGWQLGLVLAPALGHWLWGWWGVVGGVGGGFLLHEVAFRLYAEWVAGVPTMDDGDLVGLSYKADYTYERWVGPVA